VLLVTTLEDRLLLKGLLEQRQFEGEPERIFIGNIEEVHLKKVGGLVVPSREEIRSNIEERKRQIEELQKASLI